MLLAVKTCGWSEVQKVGLPPTQPTPTQRNPAVWAFGCVCVVFCIQQRFTFLPFFSGTYICMAHTYAVFFLVSTFLSFAVEANKICVICTQTRATTNIHIPHTYAYIHTFIHLYVRLYKQTANSSMLFMQHAEATTNNERFNTPSLYRCIISAFVCMEVSEPVRIGWWVKTL